VKSAKKLDTRRFSPGRPPAVLLGGLNVLRALGWPISSHRRLGRG
jgi:hypothetical protein